MFKKENLYNLLLFLASTIALLIILEILLRFFPVSEGLNFQDVTKTNPVMRAQPSNIVTQSRHWNFYKVQNLKINNLGFRNDFDYSTNSKKKVISIVGDSYVEASQLSFDNTFYGKLSKSFGENADVLTFGFSGAPLSQYLIWAKYAVDNFKVDELTFVIVENDFTESMYERTGRFFAGYHYFKPCNNGQYCLILIERKSNFLTSILKQSVLVSYLYRNLLVMEYVRLFKYKYFEKAQSESGNNLKNSIGTNDVSFDLKTERLAIDVFLNKLKELEISEKKISFIVDGRFYEKDIDKTSLFYLSRNYFIDEAEKKGYRVLDLKEVFRTDYRKNRKRFEFELDYHWNERAHSLIHKELVKFYKAARIF